MSKSLKLKNTMKTSPQKKYIYGFSELFIDYIQSNAYRNDLQRHLLVHLTHAIFLDI